LPISVAVRSKEWICCRSLAGIAGLNPAWGIDVWLLWVLSVRGLCYGLATRPEDSTNVVCLAAILKRQ